MKYLEISNSPLGGWFANLNPTDEEIENYKDILFFGDDDQITYKAELQERVFTALAEMFKKRTKQNSFDKTKHILFSGIDEARNHRIAEAKEKISKKTSDIFMYFNQRFPEEYAKDVSPDWAFLCKFCVYHWPIEVWFYFESLSHKRIVTLLGSPNFAFSTLGVNAKDYEEVKGLFKIIEKESLDITYKLIHDFSKNIKSVEDIRELLISEQSPIDLSPELIIIEFKKSFKLKGIKEIVSICEFFIMSSKGFNIYEIGRTSIEEHFHHDFTFKSWNADYKPSASYFRSKIEEFKNERDNSNYDKKHQVLYLLELLKEPKAITIAQEEFGTLS
ncbi:hypothetical protein N9L92_00365 [Saprospiraceae bacterium]|nr:hypothetical protein [Saprospiraceae bacterium]